MLDTLISRVESVFWETRLGLDTRGRIDGSKWGAHYSATPYGLIRAILKQFRLGPDDVFLDLGCGKGRVLAMARRYPLRRIVGVEANPELIPIASANVSKQGRGTPVDLICSRAEEVDYHEMQPTAVFIYSSFDEASTDLVLRLLADSVKRSPRPFRLAYAGDNFPDVFPRHLTKTDDWPPRHGFLHHTSFWRV